MSSDFATHVGREWPNRTCLRLGGRGLRCAIAPVMAPLAAPPMVSFHSSFCYRTIIYILLCYSDLISRLSASLFVMECVCVVAVVRDASSFLSAIVKAA